MSASWLHATSGGWVRFSLVLARPFGDDTLLVGPPRQASGRSVPSVSPVPTSSPRPIEVFERAPIHRTRRRECAANTPVGEAHLTRELRSVGGCSVDERQADARAGLLDCGERAPIDSERGVSTRPQGPQAIESRGAESGRPSNLESHPLTARRSRSQEARPTDGSPAVD